MTKVVGQSLHRTCRLKSPGQDAQIAVLRRTKNGLSKADSKQVQVTVRVEGHHTRSSERLVMGRSTIIDRLGRVAVCFCRLLSKQGAGGGLTAVA